MHPLIRIASTLLLAVGLATAAACTSSSHSPAQSQSQSRDLVREEANRALVVSFYEAFFNQHRVHEAAQVVTEDYRQHNPEVPDGKAPFVDYFAEFFKANPQSQARIVRSATDGDLVYLHVHSTNGPEDRGQAVVDIFRVADGRIVEHWDVIQAVPEASANTNTMF